MARALADTREAKLERDKAVRDLHAFQLEAQSWKQEVVASKASVRSIKIHSTKPQFILFNIADTGRAHCAYCWSSSVLICDHHLDRFHIKQKH